MAIGADADIAIWDPNLTKVAGETHDYVNYNPFEGMEITGWPVTVLTRGQKIVENDKLIANPGDGVFVKRGRTDLSGLTGTHLPETDPIYNFGANIFT